MEERPEVRRSSANGRRAPWAAVLLFATCLSLVGLLLAGPVASHSAAAGRQRPLPVAAGGGEYELPEGDHVDEAERREIQAMLVENTAALAAAGLLPAPRSAERVSLAWPLSGRDGFTDPGYHAITGYVDHHPGFPGQLLDYVCGGRTYDSSSGYNHQGTDIFIWPFSWNKMAAGDVEVRAAAPGVIIGRSEGNPDQSCSLNGNRWNAVYVRHADGSVAWYGHLKRGSVTPKGIGATVATGEYLGTVGSSGNSTGPHLHFELYSEGKLVDPFAGSCNAAEGGSWWASQPNYYDSAVNKLMTGDGPVSWGSCPQPDVTHERTQFQPGDRVTFSAYYRDQIQSLTSVYRILMPDGNVFTEWTKSITRPHYTLAYWWWSFDIPDDAPTGAWRFEVDYNGKTHTHDFHIGAPTTPAPTPTGHPITELRLYLPAVSNQ